MAKNPAVNFYTSDFLTGTAFMSNEQVGAYIRLLSYQHQYGRLTEEQVLTITKDEQVLSKFKRDKKGNFYNERMEFEIEKKKKYSESRSKNRLNSTKKEESKIKTYDKDMKNICKTYEKHMENENENININKNIIDYLNNKLNSKYKYSTKITKEKINARLNEGYTLDDFIAVIDKKCNEWLGTEFERFLRPETLFGTKFESYLNQPNRKYDTKPKTSRERLREIEEKFLKGE